MSPENQNHACSITNSKDKSEDDIYVNQTTFGGVFLKFLLHFRSQNPQKLIFLLRHIYGRNCKIRQKWQDYWKKFLFYPLP